MTHLDICKSLKRDLDSQVSVPGFNEHIKPKLDQFFYHLTEIRSDENYAKLLNWMHGYYKKYELNAIMRIGTSG